jgi:hypothetical protein
MPEACAFPTNLGSSKSPAQGNAPQPNALSPVFPSNSCASKQEGVCAAFLIGVH